MTQSKRKLAMTKEERRVRKNQISKESKKRVRDKKDFAKICEWWEIQQAKDNAENELKVKAFVLKKYGKNQDITREEEYALYRQSLPDKNRSNNKDDKEIVRLMEERHALHDSEPQYDTMQDRDGLHFYEPGTNIEVYSKFISMNPDNYVKPNKPHDPNFDYNSSYPTRGPDETVISYCKRTDWFTYHWLSEHNPNKDELPI